MKGSGIWVLWLLLGAASVLLVVVSSAVSSTSDVFTDSSNSIGAVAVGRKLKQSRGDPSIGENVDGQRVHLEDYGKIDPVPSSSVVKHAPIQHGTPLNPYIPKPPPPPPSTGHDKISGSY